MRISRHQPQVVILCEDITYYHFARKYLRCHGFKRILPKIKGTSPSQFAEKLAKKICPQGLPDEAPSSLHYACNELNRLQVE